MFHPYVLFICYLPVEMEQKRLILQERTPGYDQPGYKILSFQVNDKMKKPIWFIRWFYFWYWTYILTLPQEIFHLHHSKIWRLVPVLCVFWILYPSTMRESNIGHVLPRYRHCRSAVCPNLVWWDMMLSAQPISSQRPPAKYVLTEICASICSWGLSVLKLHKIW